MTRIYDQKPIFKDGEIGYLLLTHCWSRGIMTEAVRRICEIAFSELDILRITGLVYAPNIASRREVSAACMCRKQLPDKEK